MAAGTPSHPDFDALAAYLDALSYPVRLELLHQLRFPHTLGELRLAPRRSQHGENPERPASRPAILGHLAKLEAADLVRSDQVDQDGRRQNRYVVNSLKLYAVSEDLRRLSILHAGRGPAADATGTLVDAPKAARSAGPRLVLVYGLYEGKAYSLDPALAPEAGWVIGRRKGLPVCLDYDPYVSLENSALTLEEGRYVVQDLRGKNGTSVNWEPLPRGGARALRAGDVVGVGRSLLSFVPA